MTIAYIQNVEPAAPCACDNCGHECPAAELEAIADLEQRLDAGGSVPAGQCPKCGALAYLKEDKRRAMPDGSRYWVFSRKAYRRERDTFGRGRYVPNPGARRYTIARDQTLEEARRICEAGPANVALAAGREYRGLSFYEFERQ